RSRVRRRMGEIAHSGSAVGVPGLRAVEGVSFGDACPVGGNASVSVAAELDDGGDDGPHGEGDECDDEDHGRNATITLDLPRVAESTLLVGKLPNRERAMMKTVACIVQDGFAPFEFGLACEAFGLDRSNDGVPNFDFRVIAPHPGVVTSKLGFSIN